MAVRSESASSRATRSTSRSAAGIRASSKVTRVCDPARLSARFARAYQDVLTSPTQSELFRNVPVAYMWDDHDYGSDNSDVTSPSRAAALASYRVFVPHYPMNAASESTIHQAFTVGRVRVVLTDLRSARSSPRVPAAERTLLGSTQLAWLLEELEAARDAPLVIWVNVPLPLLWYR